MSTAQSLAQALASTEELLVRYLADFDDVNAATQAPHLPNHVLWTLGHLAVTMHRAAEKIANRPLDLDWNPEPFAFGSKPTARAEDYPPLSEMVDRYHRAYSTLIHALSPLSDQELERLVPWGNNQQLSVRDLAVRMIFHNGTHTGQMVDLRRAIGMPRVIRMSRPAR